MYTRKNVPEKATSKTASSKRPADSTARSSSSARTAELTEEEKARRTAAARKRAAARRKEQERKQQKRIFLLAAGMFLTAVVVLVWAVVLMVKRSRLDVVAVDASPDATAYTAPAQTGSSPTNQTSDPGSIPPASSVIPRGVTVNGVQVGDLTVDQARSALAQSFENDLNSVAITLKNEYFNATLNRNDIGAYFDMDAALATAAASASDAQVKATMLYDKETLTQALAALNDKVPGHATNATMSIDICNHQSHFDLACQLIFTPNVIFLTNDWVWNNPFYGMMIRHAEYYPVADGIDALMPKLQSLVKRGYSIALYPEGHRSRNGRIGRFHQGAFHIARQLGLDVTPMYLYGTGRILPPKTYHLKKGPIYIEVGDPIASSELAKMGDTMAQASQMRRHYIEKYETMANRIEQDV